MCMSEWVSESSLAKSPIACSVCAYPGKYHPIMHLRGCHLDSWDPSVYTARM